MARVPGGDADVQRWSAPDVEACHEVPENFVREFTSVQRSLYVHILTQVGTVAEAEDILQQTNLVIWKKWQQFESGTNFRAWATRIATFEVLKSRDQKRRRMPTFGADFLNQVAEVSESQSDLFDARLEALQSCLRELRASDRDLIQTRYGTEPRNDSVADSQLGKDVAQQLGRPANSVYQSLGRIRRALMECIRRKLAPEART